MEYISPWIYTTYKCNLNCSYCYVKPSDEEISEQVLDNIYKTFSNLLDTKKIDYVIWRIAGGEPLLNFGKWSKTFSEFKNRYPTKSYISIISNLTILNEEMLSFFKKNDCGFGISLDGYEFSKPYRDNKTSSFEVMRNIETLVDFRGNENIDISTVFNLRSMKNENKLAEFILEKDLNWGIYLDHYYDDSSNTKLVLEKMYNIIDILYEGGYDLTNKFKFNNIKLIKNYDGCQAGKNLIAIGSKGEIWPCQTSLYDEPICSIEDFSINQLEDQLKYNIGYNYKLKKECENCIIKDECGGGCKLHNNPEATCFIIKNVMLHLLKKNSEGGLICRVVMVRIVVLVIVKVL